MSNGTIKEVKEETETIQTSVMYQENSHKVNENSQKRTYFNLKGDLQQLDYTITPSDSQDAYDWNGQDSSSRMTSKCDE